MNCETSGRVDLGNSAAAPVSPHELGSQPHLGLDAPGLVCSFESFECSRHMSGAGGFDEHHEVPLSLGGEESGTKLLLCPNHHRRQHSLIRYMVESYQRTPGGEMSWDVLEHFTSQERSTAYTAFQSWRLRGAPPISGWPAPAARVP